MTDTRPLGVHRAGDTRAVICQPPIACGSSAPRDLGRDAAVAPGATVVHVRGFRLGPCLPTSRGVIRFDRYLEARRVTYEVPGRRGLPSSRPRHRRPIVARESVGPGLSTET